MVEESYHWATLSSPFEICCFFWELESKIFLGNKGSGLAAPLSKDDQADMKLCSDGKLTIHIARPSSGTLSEEEVAKEIQKATC